MVNLCINKNHRNFNKEANNYSSSNTKCSSKMNLSTTRTYNSMCAKLNTTVTVLPPSHKVPIRVNAHCIRFLRIHFR